MSAGLIVKFFSVFFLVLTYIVYKPPVEPKTEPNNAAHVVAEDDIVSIVFILSLGRMPALDKISINALPLAKRCQAFYIACCSDNKLIGFCCITSTNLHGKTFTHVTFKEEFLVVLTNLSYFSFNPVKLLLSQSHIENICGPRHKRIKLEVVPFIHRLMQCDYQKKLRVFS